MVTCWERAGPLALLCVMFSCVFVTFPCGVLGQVCYLIVSISDLCLLSFFDIENLMKGRIPKRELIALLNLSSWCLVMVERLFLAERRGCLQFMIVVFPDHTHLLFLTKTA